MRKSERLILGLGLVAAFSASLLAAPHLAAGEQGNGARVHDAAASAPLVVID